MVYIRKHARLLAIVSVMMAAIAMPYMIPENPDNPVFRSGILSFLLLAACLPPLETAFQKARKRQLIASMFFGFFFAFALSLGSELYIYQGLLRGFGSLIRRIAVPILAAPLCGGFCTLIATARPSVGKVQRFHLPFAAYIAVIFLCWLPVWLAFWPANIRFDFVGEYNQHLANAYSSLHPLLHSIIQNNIITLGEMIIDRTFGLALLTFSQMLCLSAALAACCTFIQRRTSSWLLALLLALFFGLHPVFSVLSVSTTKDTMFAAATTALSLMIWQLLEAPARFFTSRQKCISFIILTVLTALLRNNGLFALILALPGMIIAAKGFRKKAFLLSATGTAASVALFSILSFAYHCESMPSRQLYSLPAQQLVRAYNLSQALTPEDKEEIRSWYLSDDGLVLLPQLADPAKGYLDEDLLQEKGFDAYLKLWASHLDDSLHEYTEALLMLNLGSWYPDDLTHTMIYPEQAWNGQGYLSLSVPETTEQGFTMTCYVPAVRRIIERICSANRYQRIPLISATFSPAVAFWMVALACTILIAKKRTILLPASLGAWGLWLSYLMGPCTLPRYALPLFALAPVLLIAALYIPTERSDAYVDPTDSQIQ